MTYSLQAFSSGQVITAGQLNQIEVNIREHVHGVAGISENIRDSFYADVDQTLVSGSLHIIYCLATSRISGQFTVVNSSELSADNAGWYDIHANISMTSTDSNFTPNFECYKNAEVSPSFKYRNFLANGAGGSELFNFGTVYLDGGTDYLTFKMSGQSSGAIIEHSIDTTFIEVIRQY